MADESTDELRATIYSARAYTVAQLDEARRLEAELPILNERLGLARRRQERLMRPSTLVTETGRRHADVWLVRLHLRRRRT